MNKLSYDEVKDYIENKLKYKLLSNEYVRSLDNIKFKDKDGYFYYSLFSNLKSNHLPSFVSKSNIFSIQNIKLWCKLNNKAFKLISDTYINAHSSLNWQCLKEGCEEEFEMDWGHIYTGNGCSFCRGFKVGLSNCLATLNPKIASEWHPTLNGNLTPNDITINSGKRVWWKCEECDHEWYVSPNNRKKGTGCAECNESKGEIKIRDWLKQYDIYYISQKEFIGLLGLGNGNLSYDFYLPKYNLLIEYQGIQHEKLIDFKNKGKKHAEKDFKQQQEHDCRKKDYALRNKYNFLEIWYWDFDNIEIILDKYIKLIIK